MGRHQYRLRRRLAAERTRPHECCRAAALARHRHRTRPAGERKVARHKKAARKGRHKQGRTHEKLSGTGRLPLALGGNTFAACLDLGAPQLVRLDDFLKDEIAQTFKEGGRNPNDHRPYNARQDNLIHD
nr:MAG TPA: hypothetical protein [Caudoviricetes sp.]